MANNTLRNSMKTIIGLTFGLLMMTGCSTGLVLLSERSDYGGNLAR